MALAISALLTATLVESARRGMSGLHARAAVRAVQPTSPPIADAADEIPDRAAVRFAEARLADALALNGRAPALIDTLARTLILRDRSLRLYEDRRDLAALGAARDLRRREVRLRPTWPYAWANLATTKSLLSEIDTEFVHALERAAQTGPREVPILGSVADLGLAHWHHLPERARRAVATALGRLAAAQPSAARRLARRHAREDLLDGVVQPPRAMP